MMNTIAIDADGEDYGFQTFQFSGVKDVIDATCNMLSALTNIPQTILFGRAPAGENSTGESDMENWYSFVGRLQRLTVRPVLLNLLDVIFIAGRASGEIEEEPDYELKFNPLWTMTAALVVKLFVNSTRSFEKESPNQLASSFWTFVRRGRLKGRPSRSFADTASFSARGSPGLMRTTHLSFW